MASRGSVIPLFINQIKNGNPITITDPDMTRFMMTLDDAVDLVLHAFEYGNNGDIFSYKRLLRQQLKHLLKQFNRLHKHLIIR